VPARGTGEPEEDTMASTSGPDGHDRQSGDRQSDDPQRAYERQHDPDRQQAYDRQGGYGQGGYGQGGYGQGGYGQPPVAPRNGAGIAALILGILSILLFWLLGLGLVPGIIGLVLGIVGLRRARRGRATNRGSALIGVITSIVGIVLSLVVAVVLAVVVGAAWNTGGRELLDCIRSSSSSEAAVQQCVDTYNQRLDDIGTVNP